MDELKPCPFCGSIAEMCSRPVSFCCGERAYQVKCTYCGASIPEFWSREAEVKAWNRRAESEDKMIFEFRYDDHTVSGLLDE